VRRPPVYAEVPCSISQARAELGERINAENKKSPVFAGDIISEHLIYKLNFGNNLSG